MKFLHIFDLKFILVPSGKQPYLVYAKQDAGEEYYCSNLTSTTDAAMMASTALADAIPALKFSQHRQELSSSTTATSAATTTSEATKESTTTTGAATTTTSASTATNAPTSSNDENDLQSLYDVDEDVLKELPEDIRLEIENERKKLLKNSAKIDDDHTSNKNKINVKKELAIKEEDFSRAAQPCSKFFFIIFFKICTIRFTNFAEIIFNNFNFTEK